MGMHDAIAWTPEMDAKIGSASDATIGVELGLPEDRVRYRRRKLGIQTYRSTRGPVTLPCASCGKEVTRPQKHLRRASRLYCSRMCADQGQKRRDSETLRYGPGWKNVRAKIRLRDQTCRCCGKAVEENGKALTVHHLKPFRFGGTNHPRNLRGLCVECHPIIEAITTSVLASIPIDVKLAGSVLTVVVDGVVRWHGSVRGADFPTQGGSAPS